MHCRRCRLSQRELQADAGRVNFFFFSSRRRHTRLQGDWSSDVCSSDLPCSRARPCCGASRTWRTSSSRCSSIPPRAHEKLARSEEHTSELQSPCNLVCRLLLEKKKTTQPKL